MIPATASPRAAAAGTAGIAGARRTWVIVAVCVLAGAFCWLVKINDLEGSYGGLTDDHLFYAVRGWQILFGELPVRDFVDHGAPLTYYLSAAAQVLFGRSTWSEFQLADTLLATSVALTCWIACRASGSILLGVLASLFQLTLGPRLYNYPKLLIYAVAIPALWAFLDRPSGPRRLTIAVITAVAFLFRHDHGVFVGVAMCAAILMLRAPWRERVVHLAWYATAVLAILLPYLLFIQWHGGLVEYFRGAIAWAQRDRARAPLIWPAFALRDGVATTFYYLVAVPLGALLLLSWRSFRESISNPRGFAVVAILGVVLDAGFLRSPLVARFGDVSVPLAILFAVATVGLMRVVLNGTATRRVAVRAAAALIVVTLAVVPVRLVAFGLPVGLRRAGLLDGPRAVRQHTMLTIARLEATWPLENWVPADVQGPMRMALYLRDCTRPSDHVFVSGYLPEVAAMARRPFAGGHADLRPSFSTTMADQTLTVERLARQSVPIAIVPPAAAYDDFRQSFPIVDRYFSEHYVRTGDHDFGDGLVMGVLAERGGTPVQRSDGLLCFGGHS